MTRMKSGRLVWGLLGALLLAAGLWWGLTGSGPVRAKEVRPPVEPTVQPAVDWEALARRYGVSGKPGFQRSLNVDSGYDWHTFYPFSGPQYPFLNAGMAVDSAGNIYLAGASDHAWTENGATPLHPYSGGQDIVIVKLNSAGIYQWHTFYGSDWHDRAHSLTIDAEGNLYVTGGSENSWNGDADTAPLHPYTPGDIYRGRYDLFVLKLNSAGAYQWHTFYGGTTSDHASSIALSGSNDLVVVGVSQGLTTTWMGDGNTPPLHSSGPLLVLKLTRTGGYLWHTFYGNNISPGSSAGDVAVAENGDLYVAGYGCDWLGDNDTAPLHLCSGSVDWSVLKLNGAGAYQWHTFYGSIQEDTFGFPNQIALDQNGGVYLTGASRGAWSGDGGVAPLHPYAGEMSLTVLKLNSVGAYQWHTFYGKESTISSGWVGLGSALAVDTDGDVYVSGFSYSSTWTGDDGTEPILIGEGGDALLLKLDSQGRYRWHLFYGGAAVDAVVLQDQAIYLAGINWGSWTGPGGIAPIHPTETVSGCTSSCYDFYAMKLRNLPRATTGITYTPLHPQSGETVTVTAWVTGETGMPTGTVTMTLAGFSPVTGTLDAQGVVTYVTPVLAVGNYTVTAEYGGYGEVLGSSAFTVAQVRMLSAVELTVSPTTVVRGQPIVYQARVTDPGMPTRTMKGTVRFVGIHVNAWDSVDVPLDSNGYAVYTVAHFGVYNYSWILGPQWVTATYQGNEEYYPVAATITWTLARATSVVSLTMEPVTPTVGDWVVYTATRGMVEPGSYSFSSIVTFTIGSHEPVTQTYWDLPVTCTFQVTQAGLLPVKAEVAEDYWYTGSQAVLIQTVLKALTVLSVTGPVTVTAGQPAVLTARVQPTATGVVSWTVPGRPAVTGTLDANSVATGTLILPAAGHYSVTVTYGGDAIYAGSAAQHELAVWARLYLPLVLKSGQ